MNSSFGKSRFHTWFFAILYVLYLYVLFFVVDLNDITRVSHTCARLLAATGELAAFYLTSLCLLRLWLATRRVSWWLLCMLVSGAYCMVYVLQLYSLYLSNNFISVLAIQNAKYAVFTTSPLEVVATVGGLIWLGILGVCTWRRESSSFPPQRRVRSSWRPIVAMLAVALLFNAFLLTQQRRRVMLEPDFRQTPVASLVVNARIASGAHEGFGSDSSPMAGGKCSADPIAGKVNGYPFEKDVVNSGPLPFRSKEGSVAHPNVIVIFTEGTSTRLIGAYGGRYAALTPNIDRLASRSMQVKNYFNHTAATDRGIIGQNSSSYSFTGGSQWSAPGDKSDLTGIRRQTLASVLNGQGYGTYFFEPEHDGTPFTQLVESLSFQHTYTYDRIAALLRGAITIQDQTDQLDDDTLFRGLTAFLRTRASSDDGRPFFIGTYNIGTHAFERVVKSGLRYGDGKNQTLNKLHNYDAAIGKFLDYFYSSPYAKNTILVFTADHATYPEKPYREVAGKDLKPFFVDRIPLLIDDPVHHLPRVFDADGRNSLDMAPTVLQLLGVNRVANSFLGRSLFESRSFPVGFSALGNDFFVTTATGVYATWEVPAALRFAASCEQKTVEAFYSVEQRNHIFAERP